jgi:Ca2+-binding RTX toxin-like protein
MSATNIVGSDAAETLTADSNDIFLWGENGIDTINGNGLANLMAGGNDNTRDTLNGNGGDDVMLIQRGNDTFNGGSGFDTLRVADYDVIDTVIMVGPLPVVIDRNGFEIDSVSPNGIVAELEQGGTGMLVGNNDGAGENGFALPIFDGETSISAYGFMTPERGDMTVSSIEAYELSRFGDVFFGNEQADTIDGRGGNDFIDGGAGADVIVGGDGIDTAIYALSATKVSIVLDPTLNSLGLQSFGDAEGDRLIEIENIIASHHGDFIIADGNSNRLEGQGGDDFISGLNGDDRIFGGTGNDTLNGNAGFDTLKGNDQDDVLKGGSGADVIEGGDGIDTASFADLGGAVEVFLENTNGFQQRAIEHTGVTTGSSVAQVNGILSVDELDEIENAIGTGFNDRMFGNGGANRLEGRDGNDFLNGNGGIDTLIGGDQNDSLDGGSENDRLEGGNNDDFLRGGSGNDTMIGGSGIDVADYSLNSGYVLVRLGEGAADGVGVEHDLAGIAISGDTLNSIENVIGTGRGDDIEGNSAVNRLEGRNGNDVMAGHGGADVLLGGENDDILAGGLGADTLNGGNGSDTASYENLEVAVIVDNIGVTVNLATNIHLGADAAGDNMISIENVVGSKFDDVLLGDGNANILEGNLGRDALVGNGGLDTFVYRHADDAVAGETVDGGAELGDMIFVDSQDSTVDLRNVGIVGVEKLQLRGSVEIDMGGGVMQGGIAEAASLGFADTLGVHGSLVDLSSFVFSTWSDGVDVINLFGTAGNDKLTGSNFSETFFGSTGVDIMRGNGGDDTYELDTASDQTIEAAGGGIDTVKASITHALRANFENLVLTGTANINGGGNGLDNGIDGNSGNNIMNGFAGEDDMRGHAGNDTYHVDNVNDHAIETVNEGTDRVISAVDFTLGANVEILNLTGTAANGTGNGLFNSIFGNGNDNRIDGRGGNDTMSGGAGGDTYVVDSIGDVVIEAAGAGIDTIESFVNVASLANNVENLTLLNAGSQNGNGNGLGNTIVGGGGVNFIDGKLGADTLTGNGGIDRFLFTTALGAGNIDTITDFTLIDDGFRLDDAIFTGLSTGFLGVNAFRIGAAAADAEDRIVYNEATGALFFDSDGSGAAAAQQFATVSTGLALTNADFFIF